MIREWITQAIEKSQIEGKALHSGDVDYLLQQINMKFMRPVTRPHHLWETFEDDISYHCPNGWGKICDYGEAKPILLYEEEGYFHAFSFSSSDALRLILKETPGFEFYITNQAVDFVLCQNHHDYLIGVGACRPWMKKLFEGL